MVLAPILSSSAFTNSRKTTRQAVTDYVEWAWRVKLLRRISFPSLSSEKMTCTVVAVGTRPKHPYGRRNTFIQPYLRHALGYSTAEWEESLTVKFRDLRPCEPRLYTLSQGFGIRDKKSSPEVELSSKQLEMKAGEAIALMVKFRQMLVHGERTVEGVFEALGVGERCVSFDNYITALEHISMREGTAIPTGAAEQALASLYRLGEGLWPFLTQHISGEKHDTSTKDLLAVKDNKDVGTPHILAGKAAGTGSSTDAENHIERGGGQRQKQRAREKNHRKSTASDAAVSYSLAQLRDVLEAFICTRGNRECVLEGFALKDLTNFLYLRGQAKITVQGLRALIDKYGRWAAEKARREAQDAKSTAVETKKSAAAGKAFAFSEDQLDAAVEFFDLSKDGEIDLEELIQALKQERAAIGVLSKVEQQEPSRVASDAVKETGGTLETEQDGVVGKEGKADKEEKPVFSCEEAKSFTDYLVESQQAFSLINVADIQHGIRGAKRAGAQAKARDLYRITVKTFAASLRKAGMNLESDEGWERWFDMCELGLRAGGAEGAKRLVGRQELKRGLRTLSAAPRVDRVEDEEDDGVVDATLGRKDGWNEQEIDELLDGLMSLSEEKRRDVDIVGGGRDETRKDITEIKENEFRDMVMMGLSDEKSKTDQEIAAWQAILPLCERLEAYLKDKGLRLGQLFDRMVAWARDASEEDIMQYINQDLALATRARAAPQRGDESCVPPPALRAVISSLRTGGLSGPERAKVKAEQRLEEKEADELRAVQEKIDEAARRLDEAERSGASAVLDLLRTSIASKSIRVVELFKAMDTSKDGLISRGELRRGLQVIAEGAAGEQLSFDQIRTDCRKRRQSVAAKAREEQEKRGTIKLRARMLAVEGSGAAKVLRRIHEHLLQTGLKVVDIFRSFSLRGHLDLTTTELEIALSLVDGLDLSRREVRSVVRFLDKDASGTIDIKEIGDALREFRELSRNSPSLGIGPMTLVDSSEIERLAKFSFSDILASRRSKSQASEDGATTNLQEGQESVPQTSSAGYSTEVEGADDVQFRRSDNITALNDGGRVDDKEEGRERRQTEENMEEKSTIAVSVSEIAAAFEAAFRQSKAISEGQSARSGRHPAAHQPSADTQHAQACVDKVMEWLRSSRTFDRAPTGRVPTLAGQMTEHQRMEMELQNKLQEKRRRAAGQRHWEQWVLRKARRRHATNENGDTGSVVCNGGSQGSNTGDKTQRKEHERVEAELRRKEQDAAFAAWARKKDRVLRARRKEKRRMMKAGSENNLDDTNGNSKEARCTTPTRLPRLSGRVDSDFLASSACTTAGESLATSGTKGSRSTRIPSKAERKALDLAVTRVAVSPYRVRPKDQYQHSKHIEGGKIIARMARNSSAAFPKALVKEGWEATSELLGSASMSLIDPIFANHSRCKRKENKASHSGDKGGSSVGHRPTGAPVRRIRRRAKGRPRSRRSDVTAILRPIIPSPKLGRSMPQAADNAVAPPDPSTTSTSTTTPTTTTVARDGVNRRQNRDEQSEGSTLPGLGTERAQGNHLTEECLARVLQQQDLPPDAELKQDYPQEVPPAQRSDTTPDSRTSKAIPTKDPISDQVKRAGTGGSSIGSSRTGRESPPARDVAGARPDGRRGSSRGAEGGAGGGGDGVAGEFQRPQERGKRETEDMEFPIQSQALPDWADTIKDLPIDDPYYEQEDDDFEPDEDV